MQCIVGYIVLSVLSKCWFLTRFGGNISAPRHGCVKQALHGFLEFELFKTRPNNYWNLWKTKINLLYCISTSTTFGHFQYTTLFCITLTCNSSDATNFLFTLHHNSLANAEVWRCIFICRVIVIQFPDEQ